VRYVEGVPLRAHLVNKSRPEAQIPSLFPDRTRRCLSICPFPGLLYTRNECKLDRLPVARLGRCCLTSARARRSPCYRLASFVSWQAIRAGSLWPSLSASERRLRLGPMTPLLKNLLEDMLGSSVYSIEGEGMREWIRTSDLDHLGFEMFWTSHGFGIPCFILLMDPDRQGIMYGGLPWIALYAVDTDGGQPPTCPIGLETLVIVKALRWFSERGWGFAAGDIFKDDAPTFHAICRALQYAQWYGAWVFPLRDASGVDTGRRRIVLHSINGDWRIGAPSHLLASDPEVTFLLPA
jgi:hypothetical protein